MNEQPNVVPMTPLASPEIRKLPRKRTRRTFESENFFNLPEGSIFYHNEKPFTKRGFCKAQPFTKRFSPSRFFFPFRNVRVPVTWPSPSEQSEGKTHYVGDSCPGGHLNDGSPK